MQVSSNSESWSFTIIRSQGLGPLRPEKGWRAIVTVTFDQQHHEIELGCDGQNPNLKRPFYLQHADPKSHVDISVWHKSQTKRKTRKRNEVASARVTLGDVLKRQGQDSKGEISLSCLSTAGKRGQSGRNKQQQYSAYLLVKLRAPASFASESETSTLLDLDDVKDDVHNMSDGYSSGNSSDTLSAPPTPTGNIFKFPTIPDHKPKSKRRRVRGYSMDPTKEGELSEVSIEDDDYDADDAGEEDQAQITVYDCDEAPPRIIRTTIGTTFAYIAASLLPTHIPQRQETIGASSMDSTMSAAESTVSRFSNLRSLRDAETDEDFEKILKDHRAEWYQVGGLLMCVIAADVATFSMGSSGSVYTLNTISNQIIAASSILSGLGLVVDMWFMLRYSPLTPDEFRRVALDVNDTYVTYSLTARLPIMLLSASALSFVVFLLFIAASVWPVAAIVLSGLTGLSFTLGYLIYGFNAAWRVGARVGKRARKAVVSTCRRVLFWRRREAKAQGEGEEGCSSVSSTPMSTPPPAYTSVPALLLSPPVFSPGHARLSPLSSLLSLASPLSISPDALPDAPDTPPMPPMRPPKNPARKAVRCR